MSEGSPINKAISVVSSMLGKPGKEIVDESSNSKTIEVLHAVPARDRGKRLSRLRQLVSRSLLLGLVVVPTSLAFIYTTLVATRQYTSEFRFSIRGWEAPTIDTVGGLLGNSGTSGASGLVLANSYIVTEYLRSSDAIEAIRQRIDPIKLYSDPNIDYFARYRGANSIDQFLPYWRAHVQCNFDPLTGIITAMVEAMNPNDAKKLAQELRSAAERLVNQLSGNARDETLTRWQEDVERHGKRLREARSALQVFRNTNNVVDPSKEIEGLMSSVRDMHAERAKAKAEIEAQGTLMSTNAPTIIAARARLRALDNQIKLVEEKLASTNTQARSLSNVLTQYQDLEIQQQIAERTYSNALDAFERARRDAERKQIYLASFIEPRASEIPSFPTPLKNIAMTFGIGICCYFISIVIAQSIIDRARSI